MDMQVQKMTINIAETAQMLGVCRTSAFGLVLSGKIASVKVGRSRRILIKSVYDFLGTGSERQPTTLQDNKNLTKTA